MCCYVCVLRLANGLVFTEDPVRPRKERFNFCFSQKCLETRTLSWYSCCFFQKLSNYHVSIHFNLFFSKSWCFHIVWPEPLPKLDESVFGDFHTRPCCFPVSEGAFLGSLFGQKSRCISKPIRGAKGEVVALPGVMPKRNSRCISKPIRGAKWPKAAKPLKITPTQVKKRYPWARQAMLFPRFGGRVVGSIFCEKSWLC